MNNKNKNTYRNITITSILTVILITSGIGVASAAEFTGSNIFGDTVDPNKNIASGSNSAAFGTRSEASGNDSFAAGSAARAFGEFSTAHNYETVASGSRSAAFNYATTASGLGAASFGGSTLASGLQSAAFGSITTAQSHLEFVIGQCNEDITPNSSTSWDADDTLFVIGIGVSSAGCTSNINAVTVLKNGNVGIGVSNPQQLLVVKGIINSTGGFVFPDGTTQTTANVDNSITNEIETWSTLSGIPAGFSDNTDNVNDGDFDSTNELQIAGNGLLLNNTTFSVDTSKIQNRVTGVCISGSSISTINADGTVNCETDDNTQLDQTGVTSLGFVTGSHTVDTNLNQTGIEALGFVTGNHTVNTNTQLTENQVDTFVANNGYSTGNHTIDTTLDQAGIEGFGFVTGSHTIDTNTQLDATAIVGFGFEVGPHTVDTNTQLDQTGVETLGFVTGSHTIDTDTQLTETQVDTFVANNGYSTGAHTIDTTLNQTSIETLGFVTGSHTIDTDTQLTETQVDNFVANNGYSTGPHTDDTNLDKAGIEAYGFVTGSHLSVWSQSGSDDISYSSGKIGIGTSNPTSELHIKGSSATDAEIFLQPGKWSSEGNYGQIKFGDDNHYIRGEFQNGMTFYDTNKFLFAGGNVGIGIKEPNSKLEVSGYIELDTSSGIPQSSDCDKSNEVGRMKMDSANNNLYVCSNNGWQTYTP